MSRTPKHIARHKQQIQLLSPCAKRIGVILQAPRKQVEGAIRFYTGVAIFRQSLIEPVPVALVYGQITGFLQAFGHCVLHQGSCSVVPDGPGNLRAQLYDALRFLCLWADSQISNTLTRQRKRFREGITGDRVVIEAGGVAAVSPGVQDLTVGLVRDQIDRVVILPLSA